jgi:excisionase family DNA binding protein
MTAQPQPQPLPTLPNTSNGNELLTDEDASKILGVTVGTLSVWRSTGRYRLPFVKVGHKVRYRRGDLEAWLASRRNKNGSLAQTGK